MIVRNSDKLTKLVLDDKRAASFCPADLEWRRVPRLSVKWYAERRARGYFITPGRVYGKRARRALLKANP